jgi:hypothetical protein
MHVDPPSFLVLHAPIRGIPQLWFAVDETLASLGFSQLKPVPLGGQERQNMAHEHWRYFIALEQDLETTARYVEPVKDNFAAYSIEFVRLLLSACSEIDVVCKVLCQKVDASRTTANIDQHRDLLLSAYPKFPSIIVHVPRFSITLQPWNGWAPGSNPRWWKDHNLVKHQRHEHFALANLQTCLGAMSGLYSLLVYLYRDELLASRLEPRPRLFRLEHQPVPLVAGHWDLPDFPSQTRK